MTLPLPNEGTQVLLVTPFDTDTALDHDSLANLVEFVLDGGAQGVVGLGTTGEFFTLTGAERIDVTRRLVGAVRGRVPVTIGVGAEGTARAVSLARSAQDAGADCVMAIPPFYFAWSEESQVAHFRAIAAAVDIPVMIYDGAGGIKVSARVIAEVAKHAPNLQYAKLALPDPSRILDVREQVPDVVPFAGDDSTLVAALRAGARGSAIATGNIQPHDVMAIHQAFDRGDEAGAVQLFASRLAPSIAATSVPKDEFIARFKVVLAEMGVIATSAVRPPLLPIPDPDAQDLIAVMSLLGIL